MRGFRVFFRPLTVFLVFDKNKSDQMARSSAPALASLAATYADDTDTEASEQPSRKRQKATSDVFESGRFPSAVYLVVPAGAPRLQPVIQEVLERLQVACAERTSAAPALPAQTAPTRSIAPNADSSPGPRPGPEDAPRNHALTWTPLPPESLHVSLARPFSLAFHDIEPFLAAVREAVAPLFAVDMALTDFDFFCNGDRTRTFAALRAGPRAPLLKLIVAVDAALARFSLPPFYHNPQPHVSICSTPGNVLSWLAAQPTLAARDTDGACTVAVDRVEVRIGQRFHALPLRQATASGH